MLKSERLVLITDLVNQNDIVTVSDIVDNLGVSDMTVRRDLSELENNGILKRVHGGAVSVSKYPHEELSHRDKQIINITEKEEISDIAVNLIDDNDIIFLGPGTTIEIFASKITNRNILVITNCLPVFQQLIKKNIKTYLLGGEMREKTEAFNGDITMNSLKNLRFHKAFFSSNGVVNNDVMTATIAEGNTQALALDNAVEKYLLIDTTKIGKQDFYSYYELNNITSVITNKDQEDKYKDLMRYTRVITD